MSDELSTQVPIGREDLPPMTETRRPLRADFAAWLDRIDDELVGGALLVSEALPTVTAAFLSGDRAAIPYTRAMASDVSDRVRYVEEQGFLLLAREAPVASDLRRLVSILRLITAVERSGALVRHVAELLERVDPGQLPAPVRQQVDELGRRSSDVFHRGVTAWRQRDGLALSELDTADEAVDVLAQRLLGHAELLTDAADLIALGLLARYWERIADHGVSFAQHSTFAVTGERVEVGSPNTP
ncbi:phosphate signaling complex PhoU family protein [Nitriliruptor alkaliphilus]|uniref:phosphate signaling complex PhoU family protein n=1 Tax=Nitriliruptor alkaliphilus TaxID=427918 RepID=UPI000695C819|nr:PhoU domain-containing protein [Nitriliruptor alkaliphilus]